MARANEVIRDSDREYAEYQKCIRQDFGDKRVLVVSCVPCNKRVELPIDAAVLTFRTASQRRGAIFLDEFIAYPHILCKDCLGAATIEVKNETTKRKQKKKKSRKTTAES